MHMFNREKAPSLFANKTGSDYGIQGTVNRLVAKIIAVILGLIGFVIIGQLFINIFPTIKGVIANFALLTDIPLVGVVFAASGLFYYILLIVLIVLAITFIVGLLQQGKSGK